MGRQKLLAGCLALLCTALTFGQSQPWLGVHVLMASGDKTNQLIDVVDDLAAVGINTIVTEINYGFEYQSHPELRAENPSSAEQIRKLVATCRAHHVRLIPQFQCLGISPGPSTPIRCW